MVLAPGLDEEAGSHLYNPEGPLKNEYWVEEITVGAVAGGVLVLGLFLRFAKRMKASSTRAKSMTVYQPGGGRVASLVLELQAAALDSNKTLGDVLRMAKAVAIKLKLKEVQHWIDHELNGYPETGEVPEYRKIRGILQAHNPYRGWTPVIVPDDIAEILTLRPNLDPVHSIERIVSQATSKTTIHVMVEENNAKILFGDHFLFQAGMRPAVVFQEHQLAAILDKVRTRVLDWALALESEGILGEGMSFSVDEKEKAERSVQNISIAGNFVGSLGSITGNPTFSGINQAIDSLGQAGVSETEITALKEILSHLEGSSTPEERTSWLTRGKEWLSRNAVALASLSDSVRKFIEGLFQSSH